MKKYIIGLLVSLSMLIPTNVFAAGIDHSKTNTLTIDSSQSETHYSLYKVADVTDGPQFSLTSKYKKYGVSLEDNTTETWRSAALTLQGYVERDKLSSEYEGTTNAKGNLTISGIKNGLYLVLADTQTIGDKIYTYMPSLVCLPTLSNKKWTYSETITPKFTDETITKTTSRKVTKVWKNAEKHPNSITVQLIGDGKVKDEQILNKDNNWTVSWKDLDGSISWKIVEKKVPSNYDVSTSVNGSHTIITNTKKPTTPGTPGKPGKPRLPYTGMLQWPIPILCIAGLFFIVIGLRMRKNND